MCVFFYFRQPAISCCTAVVTAVEGELGDLRVLAATEEMTLSVSDAIKTVGKHGRDGLFILPAQPMSPVTPRALLLQVFFHFFHCCLEIS
jgi:hypothetical protein